MRNNNLHTMSKQIDILNEEIKTLIQEYDMSSDFDIYDGVMYEIDLIQMEIELLYAGLSCLHSQFSNN